MTPFLAHMPSRPSVRIVEATDADEHASHLTNWEQRYDQTTGGPFHGLLEELHMPGVQLFRESTSQGMQQSCCVWPEALWFGLPYSVHPIRINGRTAKLDNVLVRPGLREFELVTPPNYTIFGIVVRQDILQTAAQHMGVEIDTHRLSQSELVPTSSAAYRDCLHILGGLLQAPQHDHEDAKENTHRGERVAQSAIPAYAQSTALQALISLLDGRPAERVVRSSLARRQRLVHSAKDYLMTHRSQAIDIPALCQHLHVSRRTLQYCFEDVLGISPAQYLRVLRLNGARRELRLHPERGVGSAAAAWGFWHLSHFANDYRKLFGHNPSAEWQIGLR